MVCNYWFDIDGVLADFCQHVVDYLKLPGHEFTEWNDPRIRDNWHMIENDHEFWLTMPVINPHIPVNVAGYITSRPVPSHVTAFWLAKNGFPYAEVITVEPMGSKGEILKHYPDVVLIDDAAHNYTDCIMHGVRCKLYHTPYNTHVDTVDRIHSLTELILCTS